MDKLQVDNASFNWTPYTLIRTYRCWKNSTQSTSSRVSILQYSGLGFKVLALIQLHIIIDSTVIILFAAEKLLHLCTFKLYLICMVRCPWVFFLYWTSVFVGQSSYICRFIYLHVIVVRKVNVSFQWYRYRDSFLSQFLLQTTWHYNWRRRHRVLESNEKQWRTNWLPW